MAETTTVIRKGRLIKALDDYLTSPTEQHLADIAKKPLFAIGLDAEIVEEFERHHCETEFLGEDPRQSWWPDICCKSDKIRCVYHEAIRMALDPERFVDGKPRPVVTTWIHTRHAQPGFETYLAENPRQVDVFWLTSGAAHSGGMRDEAPANAPTVMQELWLVGTAAEIDREWAKYEKLVASAPGYAKPHASELDPGIKILNLPGY
jgi:hypothetical protein